MSFFKFELLYQSTRSRARVGRIHTPHGIIDTPNFVAVGTNATLKGIDPIAADACDLQLMFCNTYHLIIQPGTEIIRQAGGLHAFMNRSQPIITDSGGFQVFSLAYGTVFEELKSCGKKKHEGSVIKINEEGVLFRSYRNGDPIVLTPESSVQAQKDLGADIIIPLDELPPYNINSDELKKVLDRTHRWEKRSLDYHRQNTQQQAMYAVIHGGIDWALRAQSCDYLTNLPFDGCAIGGSLGKNRNEMLAMLKQLMPRLPYHLPNHLLGIGDLGSLADSIKLGIDTFDSSYPTRCARHGLIFTEEGDIKIMRSRYKNDFSPLQAECPCHTCKNYSRAYLHHLFKAKELTALSLASIHNLQHMMVLMKNYRQKILDGQL